MPGKSLSPRLSLAPLYRTAPWKTAYLFHITVTAHLFPNGAYNNVWIFLRFRTHTAAMALL